MVHGGQKLAKESGWRALIASQRMIDVGEYEAIMNDREAMDQRVAAAETAPNGGARFIGVREHRRVYV